jgi:hypothetical protein
LRFQNTPAGLWLPWMSRLLGLCRAAVKTTV